MTLTASGNVTLTVELYVNGVASGKSVSISNSIAATADFTAAPLSLNLGDLIAFRSLNSASATTVVAGWFAHDGVKGEKGTTGEKGITGDKGITGNSGASIKGNKGVKGQKGDTGDKGIKGQKGVEGPTGPTAQKGSKGEKGQKGTTGDKGQKGVDAVSYTHLTLPTSVTV